MSEEHIDCRVHIKGEVVPMIAEVTADGGVEFNVVSAFLRYRPTSGSPTIDVPAHAEMAEPDRALVYAPWDTSAIAPGYYLLRFWVEIDMADHPGEEDYKLASVEIKRYVRDE